MDLLFMMKMVIKYIIKVTGRYNIINDNFLKHCINNNGR